MFATTSKISFLISKNYNFNTPSVCVRIIFDVIFFYPLKPQNIFIDYLGYFMHACIFMKVTFAFSELFFVLFMIISTAYIQGNKLLSLILLELYSIFL